MSNYYTLRHQRHEGRVNGVPSLIILEGQTRPVMKNTFRSLAGRDFRLYFIGQCISLVGTWVQQVAFAWIAYRVTGSAFMLGIIAFCGQFPMLVLTPFSGILADRFSRRNVLAVIQVFLWKRGCCPDDFAVRAERAARVLKCKRQDSGFRIQRKTRCPFLSPFAAEYRQS